MQLICFPSDDPLRDAVLPVQLQPDQVRLAVLPSRQRESERLAHCLADRGLKVETVDWPAFDACTDHAAEVLSALGGSLEASGEREVVLALGHSAGPWELVCQQVLRDLLRPGEFRVLSLTGDSRHAVRIEPAPVVMEIVDSLLKPADYLAACSATLRRSASDETRYVEATRARRGLTLALARDCEALGPTFGTLNYLAHQALDETGERLVEPKQHLPFDAAAPLRRALGAMSEAGLIDHDGGRELIFRSSAACHYLAGGWLEEYAWLTASELDAEHVHGGLELTWNAGAGISPRNELDLFVLHRNRALTVECKTGFMGQGDDTAQILYKLDSIADRLSALPGNAVLLSAREVPELIAKRARSQGTEIFDAGRLPDFQARLKDWLQGKQVG
ncbi:MAG: DUF1887 family protein [Gammaproteobacteria bacterium]|jgi:hypothetical protein|nr:DUF1887 family protein [Gammaproteobacteria bacterium]